MKGISVFPLKQIPLEKGDVWHGLKNSDEGFKGFGEVYFTLKKVVRSNAFCHSTLHNNF